LHVLSAEHDTTNPAPPPPHVPTQIEATGSECSAHECVGLTEADDVDAGSSRAARHQTLTTVSSPPVTSTDPSLLNAMAETALKCAGHVLTSLPVDTSHRYAAPVRDPAAKKAPSGEDATTPMGSPTKNLWSADSLSRPHTSSAFLDTCALTEGNEGWVGEFGQWDAGGNLLGRRRRELVVGSERVLTEVVFAEFAQAAATARRRPDVVRRGNEWSEEGPIRC
jgi:hypothetical protein